MKMSSQLYFVHQLKYLRLTKYWNASPTKLFRILEPFVDGGGDAPPRNIIYRGRWWYESSSAENDGAGGKSSDSARKRAGEVTYKLNGMSIEGSDVNEVNVLDIA